MHAGVIKMRVKRLLCVVLITICAMAFWACAAEAADTGDGSLESVEVEPDGSDVMPIAALSLSFSDLASRGVVYSADEYNVAHVEPTIRIHSATWASANQDIGIGWYNVDTQHLYYASFSGGSLVNKRVTSQGLPDGGYKVIIINLGTKPITGAMQYTVS